MLFFRIKNDLFIQKLLNLQVTHSLFVYCYLINQILKCAVKCIAFFLLQRIAKRWRCNVAYIKTSINTVIFKCPRNNLKFNFQSSWYSNSVTNLRSVPARFFSIHWSIFSFNSGLKWFFQSPVLPKKKEQ